MRKFIKKIILFLVPLIIIHVFTFVFYDTKKGDLLRLGYIIDLYPSYRDTFSAEFNNEIRYSSISGKPKKKKFKILTIGDSFSEQAGYGYQNYLANEFDVLHIDRFISQNEQIQTLLSLTNGDFFETYSVEYVILQNVERLFTDNAANMDTAKILLLSSVDSLIHTHNPKKEDYSYKFPSDRVIKFPYNSIKYLLLNNSVFNEQVYKAKINTTKLFSNKADNLLFYYLEIISVEHNNNSIKVSLLNETLNNLHKKLLKKGIKLIVLPSPDKYDFYYDFIENKSKYPKPLFFEKLDSLDKHYLYIDSKKILKNRIADTQDIYYYDDTHWSPWSAKIIAKEISNQINKDLSDK